MKWFTYCNNTDTVHRESNAWRSNTTHKRPYSWNRSDFGLLLQSDDEEDPITEADITALTGDPVLTELFPNGYFVMPIEDRDGAQIITAAESYVALPDRAQLSTPLLRVVAENASHTVSLRQRYNDCRSLVKAIGCADCPDKGLTCIRRALPVDATDLIESKADDDDAKELLKNRVTKLGPFTYVSPKLTIPAGHVFVPSYRHYMDHDFAQIADNSTQISAATKKAAVNKRFRKENCSRCPLQRVCDNHRNCMGPYPSEEVMAAAVLEEYAAKLAAGPFKPWQFWAIARGGGYLGQYQRKAVVLHGLEWASPWASESGWRAEVWREKCDLSRLTSFTDYDELREIFTGLPDEQRAKENPYWGRPENDLAVALYLRLTEQTRSVVHRGGWGGDYYSLLYKTLRNDCVTVRFAGPRYYRHPADIRNFADYYSQINLRLGHSQEQVRTDGVYPRN